MSLDKVIELRKASIHQKDKLILSDVNFSLSKGELVYFIGKVGSGKSSILKTLYGELPLKDGYGKITDYDLAALKPKEIPYLRRKLGIVFQDFQLLTDRNVYDNLLFVLKSTGWKKSNQIKDRINDVLNKVKLIDKIFHMPNQLSGCEQQRVVIARALLNDPEVILADEPTGNLDPHTSEDILKLLIDISKTGRVVVIATHDYPLIRRYPSVIYKCNNGSVTEAIVPASGEEEELESFMQKYNDVPELNKPGESVEL